MPVSTRFSGIRLRKDDKYIKADDDVALDLPIGLYINDKLLATIYATPEDLEELAIGFLISQGILDNVNEILDIKLTGVNVNVIVSSKKVDNIFNEYSTLKVILSSCGLLDDFVKKRNIKVESNYRISISELFSMIRVMGKISSEYRRYMALHTAGIFEDMKLVSVAYDVNRHVAIDKVIGKAIKKKVNFQNSVLITSGRLSADMILKSGGVGIPITVSLRGPLYSGLRTALNTGITCIALTRGGGFTIYTHPERIILD